MALIQVTDGPGGFRRFKFKYDPAVIEMIKALPRFERQYEPSTKTWLVDINAVDRLIAELAAAGHFVGDGKIAPAAPRTAKDFFAEKTINVPIDEFSTQTAREIVDRIPAEDRGKVFRAMAKILYPDLYR